jgi:hypothetical protein
MKQDQGIEEGEAALQVHMADEGSFGCVFNGIDQPGYVCFVHVKAKSAEKD